MTGEGSLPLSSVVMKDDTALYNHSERTEGDAQPPRKRRFTAPSTYQPTSIAQNVVNKKTQIEQDVQDIRIMDEIDERVLKFSELSIEETSSPNPSSVPLILDEGRFSFWTPSVYSSDSTFGSTTSPPESSRFFSISSGSSRSSSYAVPCALEEITIWRNLNGTKQVCAQSVGGSISDSVSLQTLDPSFSHYGKIHDVVARAGCPSIRVQIPIMPRQFGGDLGDIDSVISILANGTTSVRLMADIYRQGVVFSSCELPLKKAEPKYTDGTLFSAELPQNFLRIFRDEVGQDNAIDDVLLLRFTQKPLGAEQDRYYETLIVLCELRPEADASVTGMKVALLWSGFSPSLPEDYSSSGHSSDGEHSSSSSPGRSQRRRGAPRPTPKLSVAIPPAVRNAIQIYSESPASGLPRSNPLPTFSISHSNPLSEIPHTPLPMTPQEQALSSPAELSQNLTGRSIFMTTPSEGLYPFTLSTSSPGGPPSPAFGVLDPGSISPAGGSAPAWNTFGIPFTPSFFQRFPQTASNPIHPMTHRPVNTGMGVFPRSPDKGNENMLLAAHLSNPDSPSVYSCASYRSPP